MEKYEIKSNGKHYVFNVIKNTAEPCSVCGVPACGKEDILWYEHDGERIAFIYDGGFLDAGLGTVLEKKSEDIPYHSLPSFIRDWNECKGWEECWDYEGYELYIDDFLKTIALLKTHDISQWMTLEDLNEMQQLAFAALEKKVPLKITRG